MDTNNKPFFDTFNEPFITMDPKPHTPQPPQDQVLEPIHANPTSNSISIGNSNNNSSAMYGTSELGYPPPLTSSVSSKSFPLSPLDSPSINPYPLPPPSNPPQYSSYPSYSASPSSSISATSSSSLSRIPPPPAPTSSPKPIQQYSSQSQLSQSQLPSYTLPSQSQPQSQSQSQLQLPSQSQQSPQPTAHQIQPPQLTHQLSSQDYYRRSVYDIPPPQALPQSPPLQSQSQSQLQLPLSQPQSHVQPPPQVQPQSHLSPQLHSSPQSHPSPQPQPQSQPQPQPQPQPLPSSLSQSSLPQSSLSQSSLSQYSSSQTFQNQKLFEQINGSIDTVMRRLDGIENRLSALEIATKEVVNNQRTIQTQQRKLQESLDVPRATTPPQPVYEEPRKPIPTTIYPSVTPSMPMPAVTPGAAMMPPPHMPALVPVTHIADRGAPIHLPRSEVDQYKSDLEMAKKLQAEFDAQTTSSSSSSSASTPASSLSSQPSQSNLKPQTSSQSKTGQQECPICQARVALADLEAHVEQHFEDEEAKKAPLKPGEKPINKNEAKAGFFAKLFGPKEEEKKATNTDSTSASTTPSTSSSSAQSTTSASSASSNSNSNPASAVPYTHTTPVYGANAVNPRFYPGMTPTASPQVYRAPAAAYYPYPVQNMPGMTRTVAQPQQYLYYPNLDQPPQ